MCSKIGDLQRRVEDILCKPVTHLVSPHASVLEGSLLVGEAGLVDGSTLTAVIKNVIDLHIKDLSREYFLSMDTTLTLQHLCMQIHERSSLGRDACFVEESTKLKYSHRVDADRTLWQCGFRHGSRLFVLPPFRGTSGYTQPVVYDLQVVHGREVAILVCSGEDDCTGSTLSLWRRDVSVTLYSDEDLDHVHVPGEVTWDAERLAVIFTPDVALVGMQTYRIEVTSWNFRCGFSAEVHSKLVWMFSTTANCIGCTELPVKNVRGELIQNHRT
eukprot:TRINITY_DN9722_c0_g1_i2.p1 TRINITY_DN9722_c0_g1~~TRINITY_DN9722_c0_g1_i2.p1  ORF type:complete len:313 (-),score=2.14 TRINITY_DN9722_c0_g1_i2:103-918(-)